MAISRQALQDYLQSHLATDTFKDYTINGLHVEGKSEIHTIVTGVTASRALIERAITLQADAILVHHGYFWKNEPDAITGMKHRRIQALIQHDLNLFATYRSMHTLYSVIMRNWVNCSICNRFRL